MTVRTVKMISKDVVIIRCSKLDAARVMNSLHANAETYRLDPQKTPLAKTVGEDMESFAREISKATGEVL